MSSLPACTETYIYVLIDPRNGLPRYVGKSNDPDCRYRRHLKDARDGKPDHKSRWIASLLSRSLLPGLSYVDRCERPKWKSLECDWIRKLRADGHDLTNAKAGGDGLEPNAATRLRMRNARLGVEPHNKGKTTPPEVRQRQSEAAKRKFARMTSAERSNFVAKAAAVAASQARGQPGRKKSPEEIEKIRKSLYGNQRTLGYRATALTRAKLSDSLRGRYVSDETKKAIGAAVSRAYRERRSREHQLLDARPPECPQA